MDSDRSGPVYGVDSVSVQSQPVSAEHGEQAQSVCSMNPSIGSQGIGDGIMKGTEAWSRAVRFYPGGAECIPIITAEGTRVHNIHPIGPHLTARLTGPYPDGGFIDPSNYTVFVPYMLGDKSPFSRGRLYSPRRGQNYVGALKPRGGCIAWGDKLSADTEVLSVPQKSDGCLTYGSRVIAEDNSSVIVDGDESDN
jgi:hypothetical protein